MGLEILDRDPKKKSADQPTVLIFPGIHEHNLEVKYLAEALSQYTKDKRNICTWHGWDEAIPLSFTDKVKFISDLMPRDLLPYEPYPIWLVGYSFGCTTAYNLALELKEKGFDPHLIFIDGVSPQLSQQYFESNSLSKIDDVLLLINYAANFTGLEPFTPNSIEKMKLQNLSLPNLIDTIIQCVINLNENVDLSNLKNFNRCVAIVKSNLMSLIEPQPLGKISKINLLMTEETIKKYEQLSLDASKGGWEQLSESVSCFTDYFKDLEGYKQFLPKLSSSKHTDLMKEDQSGALSAMINKVLTTEVPKDLVLMLMLTHKLTTYSQQNPDVSKEYVSSILESLNAKMLNEDTSVTNSPTFDMSLDQSPTTSETCSGNRSPMDCDEDPLNAKSLSPKTEGNRNLLSVNNIFNNAKSRARDISRRQLLRSPDLDAERSPVP